MKLPYRSRPGAGLAVFVGVVVASSLFFFWGWSRPPLDRVWQIQLELLLGTRPALAEDERALLQETLVRYPLLANNMLEDAECGLISAHMGGMADRGYAYLVRTTASAPGVLSVSSPTGSTLELIVRTLGAETRGTARADAPFVWALPAAGPFPQLVEVLLKNADAAAHTAHIVSVAGADVEVAPIFIELLSGAAEFTHD